MGQQQLLLIILGVIVVGIAVAVGITMFKDSAVSANRDAVTNDLMNLAAQAQQYYRRPSALGGGQGSFLGLTADATGLRKLTSMLNGTNANGTYSISAAGTATTVVLQGLGVETGNDGSSPVKVVMNVWDDSAKVDVTQTN
jgi:Tfp pilus assembly protein PilE